MSRRSSIKRANPNETEVRVVRVATGEQVAEGKGHLVKHPAPLELGTVIDPKGTQARPAKLSREERSDIARKAAEIRWRNKR